MNFKMKLTILIYIVSLFMLLECNANQEALKPIQAHHSESMQSSSFAKQNQQNLGRRTNSIASSLFIPPVSILSEGSPMIPANNNVQSIYRHPIQKFQLNRTTNAINLSSQSSLIRNESQISPKTTNLRDDRLGSTSSTTHRIQMNTLGDNVDLALRQANGDENMFQPAFGILGNNFDWQSNNPQAKETNSLQDLSRPTTTDQSNNIMSNGDINLNVVTSTSYDGLITFNHQLEQQANIVNRLAHQREYPSATMNQTIDLNNQIISYEGPATAPPAGDFYFSSSEKLPISKDRAISNLWWTIGFGKEFERVSNLTRVDYLDYCTKTELLQSIKQRSLCRMHPKVMTIVARGIKMAIEECQARFSSSRWNCSIIAENLSSNGHLEVKVHEIMKLPNRERSFLDAIIAAGLGHAMTKACSQGELPEECSCDKKIKSMSKGKIEWVACADDIDYGARFSRDFTDNFDSQSDTVSMVNIHNNEVGRRVFKSATDISCTCQSGENGLCQTKKCWKHIGSFSDVGEELMRRYDSATHVQTSNKDPHKLRPVRRGVRKPKRKDLVYIDESPDFCSSDTRLGILGTRNRHCNSTSTGPDSCSLLCCGRGYQVFVEEIEEDCNCKFFWCCEIKCERCKRQVVSDICN